MGCLGRSPPLLPICWDGMVPAHKLVGAYGGARQQCVLMGSLQKVAIAISGSLGSHQPGHHFPEATANSSTSPMVPVSDPH
ncbi:unnamed protein product [Rangifer tarandus platyrhynchus]|uniref:Uncharacterized protein n=1 Tax=Rangifer tarandus platyrhynchus TaxID=3082113 RepID=A0AC60AAR6_RANTA